MGHIYKVAVPL